MNFRQSDPGAVQFGNFINYYQFNSAEERLKLLPTHVWLATTNKNLEAVAVDSYEPYIVLDVGCNSGVFTQLLWTFLSGHTVGRPVLILGVDIDGALIDRAQQQNTKAESIHFATVDVMNADKFCEVVESYLKNKGRNQFDAVCCFSITMWIHLNHHDTGLKHFLRLMSNVAKLLVVEPQPWKCYQTAERRLKKAEECFPLFLELKWRSQVEQQIQSFIEVDLLRKKIFECCPTKWKRRICFYR